LLSRRQRRHEPKRRANWSILRSGPRDTRRWTVAKCWVVGARVALQVRETEVEAGRHDPRRPLRDQGRAL